MRKIKLLLSLIAMAIVSPVFAQWTTSGTNIYNANSGNVGIGTTSPAAKLAISDGGAAGLEIDPISGTNGGVDVLSYNRSTSAYKQLTAKAYNYSLGTSAIINAFTIENSGNVGIGTTAPTHTLDVVGGTSLYSDATANRKTLDLLQNGTEASIRTSYYGTGSYTPLSFYTSDLQRLIITTAGNVGIGTTSPTEKLSVNGKIRAKEVKVETGWSDFVFKPDYKLRDLKATEQYIKANQHLPEIPSAAEVAKDGINLGEMNAKLLQKIEELTLYLIQKDKEISALKESNKRIDELAQKVDQLTLKK